MKTNRMLSAALPAAVLSAVVCAALGYWRFSIGRLGSAALPAESWQKAVAVYPLPEETAAQTDAASGMVEAMVEANPFSPQRRKAPPPKQAQGLSGAGAGTVPVSPQFVYKGRVQLGARQRAVLEETTEGKTHFLEVGQEVAGFKVLDIDEKRVLLSKSQTHEEVEVLLTSNAPP